MNNSPDATQLIEQLHLEKHPEGGFFRQTYRSEMMVTSPSVGSDRAAVTDIYFLLVRGQHSRFHRVLHDEVWNFYEGDVLRLYDFEAAEGATTEIVLGPLDRGGTRKHVVPAGHWQAAEPVGDFSLVGCTVAPGFDFADFSFFSKGSDDRERLIALRPDLARLI